MLTRGGFEKNRVSVSVMRWHWRSYFCRGIISLPLLLFGILVQRFLGRAELFQGYRWEIECKKQYSGESEVELHPLLCVVMSFLHHRNLRLIIFYFDNVLLMLKVE